MIARGKENMMIILLVIILVIALAIVIYNHYRINDEELLIETKEEKEKVKSAEFEKLEEENSTEINAKESETKEKIYVHIGGEVKEPGVYKLNSKDRLYKLVEKAGGINKEADLNTINLVESLEDGSRVIIPSVKQTTRRDKTTENRLDDGININQASKKELTTINGIGEVMAERIINYRQKNNGFESRAELKEVSGIGEQTYQRIKGQLSY